MIVNWVTYILTAAVATAVIWGGSPDGAISRDDAEFHSADVAMVMKKKLRRPKRARQKRTPPAPRPIPMITPWSTMIAPSWSPMVMPPATPPGDQPISEGDRQTADFKETARQISVLSGAGRPIGPEHYQKLMDVLNAAERHGFPETEISPLKEMLVRLDPRAVKPTAPPLTISTESVPAQAAIQSPLPAPPAPNCVNNPAPVFSADFTDFNLLRGITPPGSIATGGELKGHAYAWTGGVNAPVYAPIAMSLDAVAYMIEEGVPQYLLIFRIKNTCEMLIKFDHVLEPVEAIKKVSPAVPKENDSHTVPAAEKISFAAGELVARTTGTPNAKNWDFGVYDLSKEGVLAEQAAYGINRYAVCPFDFYPPEKGSQYRHLFQPLNANTPLATAVCRP